MLWTAVTCLTHANAPVDVLEMLSWGREWQLGYPKHPPLPAWIAEASFQAAGLTAVYFAGYAFTALTVWAVWRLARLMLPARDALLAALCLEGVLFYTYWGHEFNNNVVLTSFWALTMLFVYQATLEARLRDWLAAGACAGLGLLAKYSLGFLLLPLFAWMLFDARARRAWRTPGPYLAAAVMLLVVGPHLLWAAREGWPALAYARERTTAANLILTPLPRLTQPLGFLANQAAALLPLGVLLAWGLSRRTRRLSPECRRAVLYLAAVILVPLVLHLAIGVAFGTQLRGPWGMPFWVGFGILTLLVFPVRPGLRGRLGLGLIACNLAALAVLVGQAALFPLMSPKQLRIHFPGRELAAEADRLWRERFAGPIPAVAGDTWMAANVGLYAPGRPRVSWTTHPDDPPSWARAQARADDERLRQTGGVIVWDADRSGTDFPPDLASRFPTAEPLMLMRPSPTTVRVGVAVIPPASGGG